MKWYHVVYDLNVIVGSIMIYLFVFLLVLIIFKKKLKKKLVTPFVFLCIMALFNIGFNLFYIEEGYDWYSSDFRQTISPFMSGIIGDEVMNFFEYPMIYFGKVLIPLAIVSFYLKYGAMQPNQIKNDRDSSPDYLKEQTRSGLRFKKWDIKIFMKF